MQSLENNRRELQLVAKSSKYRGEALSPLQLQNLSTRMDGLATKAETVLNKFEYEEAKRRLLALAEGLETKLKIWKCDKHGSRDSVICLVDDRLVSFVIVFLCFINKQGLG